MERVNSSPHGSILPLVLPFPGWCPPQDPQLSGGGHQTVGGGNIAPVPLTPHPPVGGEGERGGGGGGGEAEEERAVGKNGVEGEE